MSDERNEAGQFTAPTEQLFGREERLVDAGYTLPPKADSAEEPISSDEASLRQAADDLAAKRAEPEIPLTPSGVLEAAEIDPKVALTVEQAAELRTSVRGDIARFTDSIGLDQLAAEIDAKRAEVIKDDPKVAKELGVEMPKDPELTKAEQAEAAEIDAMDGLDPETRKALKIPQVRQAIEQEIGKAEQAQQSYVAAIDTANQYAQASLVDAIPELAQVPVDRWGEALQYLHQNGDQRVQRAMGVIGRVHELSTAQQNAQHQHARAQYQQFEQHVRSEDQRLVQMVGSAKTAEAANQALITYLDDHGVPRDQRLNMIMSNPVLRTAEARQTIWKAAKYDEMQKAAKPHPTRAIPPVQKPGTSNTARVSSDTTKLTALQAKLEGASGDRAARIAAEIRGMKRKAS